MKTRDHAVENGGHISSHGRNYLIYKKNKVEEGEQDVSGR